MCTYTHAHIHMHTHVIIKVRCESSAYIYIHIQMHIYYFIRFFALLWPLSHREWRPSDGIQTRAKDTMTMGGSVRDYAVRSHKCRSGFPHCVWFVISACLLRQLREIVNRDLNPGNFWSTSHHSCCWAIYVLLIRINMCICIHVYTYIHTHTHTQTHIYIHMYP